MRILLVGSQGQVGAELLGRLRAFGDLVATDRSSLDLEHADAVRRVVREARPDVIVNAAAYTAVDRAEQEESACMQINGAAPAILAEEAARLGALVVHFSTDYVFDGAKRTRYDEDDPVAPLGAYGRSKLAGEQGILAAGAKSLILRTSWVYSTRGSNFVRAILDRARSTGQLRVVSDQVGVPTSAAFLTDATVSLIERIAVRRVSLPRSLYHVVPEGMTSWHGFATEICRLAAPATRIEAIPSSAHPQAARRPAYSVLSPERARVDFGLPATPWRDLLRDCLDAMERS